MNKHPDFLVLHFHAQNRAEWREALHHRVTRGAYGFNEALASYLGSASEDEIDRFYNETQTAHPRLVDALAQRHLLFEAELRLKEKVAALF